MTKICILSKILEFFVSQEKKNIKIRYKVTQQCKKKKISEGF